VSRILVLGAGYVGAKVAERALGRGDEVVLADNWDNTRREQAESVAGARVVTADVREAADIEPLVAEGFDRIVFLAAQASRPRSWRDIAYTEQTNLTGPRVVAEAVARHNGTHVVYGSSLHVYGAPLEGEVGPERPYGDQHDPAHLSKVYAELCLKMYAARNGFPLSLLRLAVVYGPSAIEHDDPDAKTVIDKFRALTAAGRPLTIDDPDAVLGAVHVEDAARILLEAGEPVANVSAETLTVGQVAAIARGQAVSGAPRWHYASPYTYEHRLLP
jgi:nucleoside-diphosphate-sugar epimerase